jgi:hypothetical protein
MTAESRFEPSNVKVGIKISALWTMLLVFAYSTRTAAVAAFVGLPRPDGNRSGTTSTN